MDKALLIVMAKWHAYGRCKTRLSKDIGKICSAKVQRKMTEHTVAVAKSLEKRSLMERKGFPESYNLTLLLDFLNSVKSGKSNVKAPVYSHLLYDNVPGEFINVNKPDILIIEGLNVLQPAPLPRDGNAIPYVSDFFDFSIFVDADEKNIKNWYIQRFLKLKSTAFREEKSYFNKYSYLSDEEAANVATSLWEKINHVNLIENILPTRQRACLLYTSPSPRD